MSSVSDIFSQLDNDAKASIKGLVDTAANNIKANPTKENLVAQGALLLLSAPTLLPGLQTDAIVAVVTAAQQGIDGLLTPAAAPNSAPAA